MKKIIVSNFERWKDEIKKEDNLLDVGCWDGSQVLDFNNKCNAFGIDIDEKKLNLAGKKIKSKLKLSDATKKIPFKIKFDWVHLSEVIEHVEKDEDLLKKISKSLKKEGKLILTTPKSIPLFEFWDPAWVRWKFGGKERHHHYSLKELQRKLFKYNLEIKRYAVRGNLRWVVKRWTNVFIKYVLKGRDIKNNFGEGYVDWMILAEKIK